jgi:hypothetical protein
MGNIVAQAMAKRNRRRVADAKYQRYRAINANADYSAAVAA